MRVVHRNLAVARRAFTLIEILIVVIILGILAAIVFPQFSNATTLSRESILKEDLRYLRTQISVFRMQHRDVAPGYPDGDRTATPTSDAFLDQMTRYTDETCVTSTTPSSTHRFGPYLSQMPPNPLNGKTGIWVSTDATMPSADESQPFGWIYHPALQKIAANLAGTDTNGAAYVNY